MHHSTVKFTMAVATENKDNDTAEEAGKIPIMQNTKQLEEGDELVVYREDASLTLQTLYPASQPNAALAPKKRTRPFGGIKRLNQPKKKAMKR